MEKIYVLFLSSIINFSFYTESTGYIHTVTSPILKKTLLLSYSNSTITSWLHSPLQKYFLKKWSFLTVLPSSHPNLFLLVFFVDSSSSSETLSTGVPLGSVFTHLLFSIYTHFLSNPMESHGFKYNLYSVDSQIYISIQCLSDGLESLSCLSEISTCMSDRHLQHNTLKLNFWVSSCTSNLLLMNIPQSHSSNYSGKRHPWCSHPTPNLSVKPIDSIFK